MLILAILGVLHHASATISPGYAYQGFVGTYHPANATNEDRFGFGITAIVNEDADDSMPLQDDIRLHCDTRNVNSVWGMLVGPSERGVVNNPNDTSLWKPASPAGMIQGAHRWSEISKLCPQIEGIVIDDFFNNYIGVLPDMAACVNCTTGARSRFRTTFSDRSHFTQHGPDLHSR